MVPPPGTFGNAMPITTCPVYVPLRSGYEGAAEPPEHEQPARARTLTRMSRNLDTRTILSKGDDDVDVQDNDTVSRREGSISTVTIREQAVDAFTLEGGLDAPYGNVITADGIRREIESSSASYETMIGAVSSSRTNLRPVPRFLAS